MYETGDWSDLTIEAGRKEFKIHKSVVCSACPFINAACTKGFLETHTNNIKLPESADIMEAMLQHFYAIPLWSPEQLGRKRPFLIELRAATDKVYRYPTATLSMLTQYSMTSNRSAKPLTADSNSF